MTQETWEAAQEALTARRHGGRGGERDYLLRGLVKCGTCGHTYGGTSWMGGKHRGPDLWYYQCCGAKSWKRLHPDQPRCKSPTVNGPKLEAALWRQVVRMTEDREATLAQVEKGCEKARQEAVQRLQELGRLQTALDGLQGSRERVNAALVVGAMTAAEAKDWKERLAAQEMDLRRQQSEIQEQWEAANRRQETVARAGRALDLLTEAVAGENTFEDRQLALSLAVEEVRVYPDRVRRPRVEVKLALKDTAESAECSRWRLCGKFAVSLNLAA